MKCPYCDDPKCVPMARCRVAYTVQNIDDDVIWRRGKAYLSLDVVEAYHTVHTPEELVMICKQIRDKGVSE